ncbi:MAG: co-chaperone GroES [Vampirovibrionales bacterium]|nr:co-chaperone GroES [Vampirovibrionales bacterium]
MTATQIKTKLQPLADRVVLEPIDDASQTAGGIFIPDTVTKERPQRAKVVAIGPGRKLENGQLEAMTVKVGDVVLFAKYGGTDVKLDGVELKIISEKDILAIIEA